MKKALALMLALMMILPLMIVANAADFALDGKLDDNIWFDRGWYQVGAGDWEKPVSADKPRNEAFDIQYRSDAEFLYVGVKTNFAPKATDDVFGNGNGTTFRLWTFVDGNSYGDVAYTTYNYIVEYYYKPSGNVIRLLENRAPTANTASVIDNAGGIEAKDVVGENSWTFELKIPLTAIKATTSLRTYASLGTPTVAGDKSDFSTLWFPFFGDNEFPGLADAPYKRYNKEKSLLLDLASIKMGSPLVMPRPAGTFEITNFADYIGGTTTIMSRVDGKTTIGEVSEITVGAAKDYNYFYLVAVGADGKVTAINHTLNRPAGNKDSFVIPEGGYVLLANANLPAAVTSSFKTIAVGDEVKLYNVDLTALSAAKTKAVTPNAGFAFRKPGTGVINYSDGENISISATTKLSDGQKASDAVAFSNAGVQLIMNKKPTDATINPSVNLALNLGSIKRVDKLVLNFYHEYNSMIGLPKDNKVMVYYSTDGFEYRRHGSYTINGTAAAGTTGVVETVIDLPDVSAQYIKVSYDIGASPFAAPETKVVWEFTAMTEIGVVERASEVTYGAAPITDGETTNVALNKDWFGIDYNRKTAAYSGDFTDGVVVEGNDFSYGAPWFAFYRNGEYGNIDYSKKGDVIIDLGENGKNIGGVRLQAAPSIGEAESIKVYASNNASAWDEVGTITTSGTGIQWAGVDFAKTIDARYIKVSVVNKGMFFMVSEIEVLSYAEAPLPDAPSSGDLPADYEATLISKDKSYVIISDGGERDEGNYKMDTVVLTDGAKHGGDIGGGFGLNVPYAEFVLDLGESRTDLFKFAADLIGGGWGIAEPTGIRIAVSDDGENFFFVGASTEKVDNFFTVELDHMVAGRYVKFMCDAGSHVWLSEIEVYAAEEPVDESEPVVDESEPVVDESADESETPPTGEFGAPIVALLLVLSISGFVVIKRRKV